MKLAICTLIPRGLFRDQLTGQLKVGNIRTSKFFVIGLLENFLYQMNRFKILLTIKDRGCANGRTQKLKELPKRSM